MFEVTEMTLTFGEKIRNLREDMDMTQTELGLAIRISQRKISYIECGKCEPNLQDILAFCEFFKVSADYLLGIPKEYRRR